MKFTITIQDLNADEVKGLIDRVSDKHEKTTGPVTAEDVKTMMNNNVSTVETPAETVVADLPGVVNEIQTPVEPVVLDKMGVPWDKRIHAGSKAMTKKNVWKKRKGIDEATFDAVVQELKGDQVPATIVATPTDTVAEPVPPTTVVEQPTPQPVAQPTPQQAAQPTPQPVAQPENDRSFSTLVQHLGALFNSGAVDGSYAQSVVERINDGFGSSVATITDIANDDQMIDYAWKCLEVDKKGLQKCLKLLRQIFRV